MLYLRQHRAASPLWCVKRLKFNERFARYSRLEKRARAMWFTAFRARAPLRYKNLAHNETFLMTARDISFVFSAAHGDLINCAVSRRDSELPLITAFCEKRIASPLLFVRPTKWKRSFSRTINSVLTMMESLET
jgi:hypothetical protein